MCGNRRKEMPSQELHYAIGVDLGGTKIAMGIVDEMGHMLEHRRIDTEVQEGAAAVEIQILKNIEDLRKKNDIPISGIGIGVAGQIESATGKVIFAPNLKWHNIPLKTSMEKAIQLPVSVVNDVRAITLGEWLYGAGKGFSDILCVFIGTGIGGGIVSGGSLMTGFSNSFGEVGHVTIDYNGPLCTCGKRGCLEAIAGGWGIAARAQEAIEADKESSSSKYMLELAGGNVKGVDAKVVIEAYHQQDAMAEQIIQNMQKGVIAGLASLINAYNPARLILGGGIIDAMPEIVSVIDKGIRDNALKAATQSLEVVKGTLGKNVGVVGSAAAIFNLIKQHKVK